MPYRMGRGDYYRGDYYRGSIFGAVKSVVGGAVKGFKIGGPIGGIFGAAGGATGHIIKSIGGGGSTNAVAPIGSSKIATPADQTPEELIRKHQVNVHKAQASGAMKGRPGATAVITPGGTTAGMLGALGMGGRKKPHMRVTNPKALRRALRRAEGFKKLALRTIKLVDPRRKAKAFGGFKKGRKR